MKLKIATDCSGIETPLMALKKLKLILTMFFLQK